MLLLADPEERGGQVQKTDTHSPEKLTCRIPAFIHCKEHSFIHSLSHSAQLYGGLLICSSFWGTAADKRQGPSLLGLTFLWERQEINKLTIYNVM